MSNETECVALLEDWDLSLYTSKFVVNKIVGPTFSSVEGAILAELIPLLGDRWKFIESRQAWLQNGCPLPGSANLLSESPPVILVTQLDESSSFSEISFCSTSPEQSIIDNTPSTSSHKRRLVDSSALTSKRSRTSVTDFITTFELKTYLDLTAAGQWVQRVYSEGRILSDPARGELVDLICDKLLLLTLTPTPEVFEIVSDKIFELFPNEATIVYDEISKNIYFVKIMNTLYFDEHVHAYVVENSCVRNFKFIRSCDSICPLPTVIRKLSGVKYVTYRHML